MGSEGTYSVKDFDEDEGLILLHLKKRVIPTFKHAAELLDVFFRVHIEFGEFFEHEGFEGSLLQNIDE